MCKLIAITNRTLCKGNFLGQIELLAKAGVDAVVLREKDLTEKEYESLAKKVYAVCQKYGIDCILHQNVAVAKRMGVKKIHLSLPLAQKYQNELDWFDTVGVSTHSLEQIEEAQKCGADYVFFGHVFATDCKKGVSPRGTGQLQEMCSAAKVPVYAIGGITPENVDQAVHAGASGVCMMSYGMQASMEQIVAFREKMKSMPG